MKTYWKNKRVLITGAGGFIGSHLAERLVLEGASVRAFVRYNSRRDPGLLSLIEPQVFSNIEVVAGDFRDSQAIQAAVNGCQYVFHLGALVSIPYSYLHPIEVAETNFMGTMFVLVACQKAQVEKLIHTSTSEVYGTAQYIPMDESHPLQGQSPYSASKIGADKLVESFYRAYELPAVTVRPFNTYGPRQSARAVIPTIITQALTQLKINLGNLETTRDFTYVDDTIDGFIKAAMAEKIEGKTFNLGTGQEISIEDLANKIIRKIGNSSEIVVKSDRLRPKESEVFRLVSDNSMAIEELGWQPETEIDQGLDKTIMWIKNHLSHYRLDTYEI
jgi:dTDP-glucose 4,6-dehydratase